MQKVLGRFQERLAYSEKPMEDLAGEKEMKDKGKIDFEKIEAFYPNVKQNTYVIYLNGGKHPFYGVPNTNPIYQELIWPHVKRIKHKNSGWESQQVNPWVSHNGYVEISLLTTKEYQRHRGNGKICKDQQYLNHSMHRLIAITYVPNPENKSLVCHKNNKRADYRDANLEWGTNRENMKNHIAKAPATLEEKYNLFKIQKWV